jgi:hypothetical protein
VNRETKTDLVSATTGDSVDPLLHIASSLAGRKVEDSGIFDFFRGESV